MKKQLTMKNLLGLVAPLLLLCGCTDQSGANSAASGSPAKPDASVVCTKLTVDAKEIDLTDKVKQKINDYYHAADIGTEYFIDSVFQEHEVVLMSDGTTLTVDNYVTNYALMQQGATKKVIQLQSDFYSYLTNFHQESKEASVS